MNIAEAKAKLSELVSAAERGEEVIIARGGNPAVRLVLAQVPQVRLGALVDVIPPDSIPDFTKGLDADELAEWGL